MDLTLATPLLALSMKPVFGFLLSVIAIFMILLVLVQRGRGGGLAGAFGGVGGSSAFGAKAGDVFTKITYFSALVWIVVCITAAKWGGESGSQIGDDFGDGKPAAAAQDAAAQDEEAADISGPEEGEEAGAAEGDAGESAESDSSDSDNDAESGE